MWKIKVRHLFYSLLFFAVSPFIFSSGAVFASSQVFNYDNVNNPIEYSFYDSTRIGFTPSYVSIQINSDLTSTEKGIALVPYSNNNNTLYAVYDSSGYSYTFINLPLGTFYTLSASRYGTTYSVVLTFYDSLPIGDSEPCPECPPIPDNPYDDKLDSINRSILIVSATALVIYFFYAIYSMFFGGIR